MVDAGAILLCLERVLARPPSIEKMHMACAPTVGRVPGTCTVVSGLCNLFRLCMENDNQLPFQLLVCVVCNLSASGS